MQFVYDDKCLNGIVSLMPVRIDTTWDQLESVGKGGPAKSLGKGRSDGEETELSFV